jgi:hypothetical protein
MYLPKNTREAYSGDLRKFGLAICIRRLLAFAQWKLYVVVKF